MRSLSLWSALGTLCLVACSSTDTPDPGPAGSSGATGLGGGSGGGGKSGSGSSSDGGSSDGGSSQAGNQTSNGGRSGATSGGSGGSGGSSGQATGGSAGGAPACGAATPTPVPAVSDCPAAAGTTPPDVALTTVNELRARMGLGCMTLVTEINTSSQKHCDYYQANQANQSCIANAHEEVEACTGFVAKSFATRMTMAGYQGSPRSEVMAFSGEPKSAIGQWVNSVYHRTPLLSPWIREMGYGLTADCDTIDMGVGAKTADDVTAVYPYPGQVDVPINFDGSHEGPTPPEPPSGWPSASPVHLYVKSYTVTSHDVFADGTCTPLPHQWLPDKEQYILYPDKPFAKGAKYRVVIKGTRAGKALDFDWTFSTKN